jgi:CheY-like chemotaxis protein
LSADGLLVDNHPAKISNIKTMERSSLMGSLLAFFRRALRVTVPCENQATMQGAVMAHGDGQLSSARILVVDDYEPFRRWRCVTLEAWPRFQVIGEASDGLEAVQKAGDLQPDLILLDIGMPALHGIEAAHRILRFVPAAKILFLSQQNDPDIVAKALSNGAKGYVHKQNASTDLLPAIEAALRGDRFVSTGLGRTRNPLPRTIRAARRRRL